MEYNLTYAKTEFANDTGWYEYTAINLPNCKNYFVSDIDQIRFNQDGNFSLIETKCKNAAMSQSQSVTYQILSSGIENGIDTTGGNIEVGAKNWSIDYQGFQFVQLSGVEFMESSVKINGLPVTHIEAINKLSFGDIFPDGQRCYRLIIQDVFVFRNRGGDLILVEKTGKAESKLSLPVRIIDRLLRTGFRERARIHYKGETYTPRIRYQGAHLLHFENGKPVTWDNRKITIPELNKILSFKT